MYIALEWNVDKNFIIDDIYCKYCLFDVTKPLVITFGSANSYVSMSQVNDDILPWGFDFVKKEKLNVISFTCIDSNCWYRSQKFYNFLKLFSQQLDVFPERLGYSGSMGGYGVSTFANVLKMDRILLFNPISTLNQSLVPFETRFKKVRENLDWQNGCFDGAETNSKGYIVYDPIFSLDKKHADRYQKNIVHLKIPGVGHQMPLHLKNLNMLQWLFREFVRDTLKKEEFYTIARQRRLLPRYYQWMCDPENKHLTNKRLEIILSYKDINLNS